MFEYNTCLHVKCRLFLFTCNVRLCASGGFHTTRTRVPGQRKRLRASVAVSRNVFRVQKYICYELPRFMIRVNVFMTARTLDGSPYNICAYTFELIVIGMINKINVRIRISRKRVNDNILLLLFHDGGKVETFQYRSLLRLHGIWYYVYCFVSIGNSTCYFYSNQNHSK